MHYWYACYYRAVYFDYIVNTFLIAVSVCLSHMHDSVCKMLMSIGDWYHIHIVDNAILVC